MRERSRSGARDVRVHANSYCTISSRRLGLRRRLGSSWRAFRFSLTPALHVEGGYHVQVRVGRHLAGATDLGVVGAAVGHPGRSCPRLRARLPGNRQTLDVPPRPLPRRFLTTRRSARLPARGCGPIWRSIRGQPRVFEHASFVSHDPPGFGSTARLPPSDWGPSQGPTGCDVVPFDPSISVEPDTHATGFPVGAGVRAELPSGWAGQPDGAGDGASEARRGDVAGGDDDLPVCCRRPRACTDEQIGIGNDDPVTCPDASKIGTVTATTPLLDEPLEGAVYVGSQESDDPASGRMFRIFIALENKQRGMLVKLAGEVRTSGNEKTGAGKSRRCSTTTPRSRSRPSL